MVEKKTVERVLKLYGEAWMRQEPQLITTIFTADAIFEERIFSQPFIGHDEIKKYWQFKVVEEQSQITFKLLSVYVDKDTAIAEWKVTFFDATRKQHIELREIAVLVFIGDKISALREYWHSRTI